jgi:hypothetical protein
MWQSVTFMKHVSAAKAVHITALSGHTHLVGARLANVAGLLCELYLWRSRLMVQELLHH